MEKQRKISIVSLLIAILLIVTITIGTSYSLWTTSVHQESTNTIDVGCFRIEFSDEGIVGAGNISLDKAYPTQDNVGKTLVPYKFNISNTCSIASSYNVILETLNTSTMDESKLDVYFNDTSVKNYTNNVSEGLSDDAKNGMNLTRGYLGAGESITYSLRVWIDYDVTVDTPNIQGKVWNGRIVVNGEATFTKVGFTNKVIGEDNVTLDIDTKNDKTVKTLECFYGNANVQSEAGTAIGTTQCQYPLTAEYAKYRVTYSDGSIDTSYVKQLARYLIKDGIEHFSSDYWHSTSSLEDGYIKVILSSTNENATYIVNEPFDLHEYYGMYIDQSINILTKTNSSYIALTVSDNGYYNNTSAQNMLTYPFYNPTNSSVLGNTIERNTYGLAFVDQYNVSVQEMQNGGEYVFSPSTFDLNNYSEATLLLAAANDITLESNIYNWYLQLAQ